MKHSKPGRPELDDEKRKHEILRGCFIQNQFTLKENQFYPEDLPPQYIASIMQAMSKYKVDQKQQLLIQRQNQEAYITQLHARREQYSESRFKEVITCSETILERIKKDIEDVDTITSP